MKKIVESKVGKLIISILISLILFNFIIPTYSHASGAWYGKLLEPIADLVCSIGDGLLNLMQGTLMPGSPKAVTRRSEWQAIKAENGDDTLIDKMKNSFIEHYGTIIAHDGAGDWFHDTYIKTVIWDRFDGGLSSMAAWYGTLFGWTDDVQKLSEIFNEQAYPMIFYGPGAIFSNRVPALDVNFLNPGRNFEKQYSFLLFWENYPDISSDETEFKKQMEATFGLTTAEAEESWELFNIVRDANDGKIPKEDVLSSTRNGGENRLANTAFVIKPIIGKWYIALRNIAIVGLMIVLLYLGIRILISSASEEKAKYKIIIKDWAVAFVLVFFIHYIMLAMITLTESFTDMLGDNIFNQGAIEVIKEFKESATGTKVNPLVEGDAIFNTIRGKESLSRGESKRETGWLDTFGYAIMYLALVFYTVMFTFKYLKRVVYMAFLTIIAPMVALTYPVDKINDKRAQAFSFWFREYLFNLLIAPINLLLYVVLVGSAIDFAATNILYGLVAIGFILEAEEFIRTMFGVKGEGGAFGSSFAAGAMFSTGLHMLDSVTRGAKGLITGSDNDKKSKNKNNDNDDEENEIDDPNARISMSTFNSNNDEEEQAQLEERQAERDQRRQEIEGKNNEIRERLEEGYLPSDYEGSLQDILDDENLYIEDPDREEIENNLAELEKLDAEDEEDREKLQQKDEGELDETTNPELELPLNEQEQEQQPGKFKRAIKGVGRASGRYFNASNGARLAKFALKTGAGLAGAAALGSIGLAAGLASKEGLQGVAKYAGGGLASGAALGTVGVNLGISGVDAARKVGKNAVKDFNSEYKTPEERRKAQNEKIEKEFYNDKNNIRYYKDKWGPDRYKEKMNQAVEMKRYGINKQDQINRALKLRDKMPELTGQQAATAVRMAENTSEAKLRNLKDRKEIADSAAAVIPNVKDREKFMTALDLYHGIDESDSKAYNSQVAKMVQREEREQQKLEQEGNEREERDTREERREQERDEREEQREQERDEREEQKEQERFERDEREEQREQERFERKAQEEQEKQDSRDRKNEKKTAHEKNMDRQKEYDQERNQEKKSYIDPKQQASESDNNGNDDDTNIRFK